LRFCSQLGRGDAPCRYGCAVEQWKMTLLVVEELPLSVMFVVLVILRMTLSVPCIIRPIDAGGRI
jgi:hypothetical protein